MIFESFNKIPRINKLNDRVVITEKLDGTNAQVAFDDEGKMWVGSRNRWLQPNDVGGKGADNFGFAAWCRENEEELRKLGPGRHFGEWYGLGIGPRQYGLTDRRFALFNTRRWGAHNPNTPKCCEVVTVLYEGESNGVKALADRLVVELIEFGSRHVPGFMKPEGVVVYLPGADAIFKSLCEPGTKVPSAIEEGE